MKKSRLLAMLSMTILALPNAMQAHASKPITDEELILQMKEIAILAHIEPNSLKDLNGWTSAGASDESHPWYVKAVYSINAARGLLEATALIYRASESARISIPLDPHHCLDSNQVLSVLGTKYKPSVVMDIAYPNDRDLSEEVRSNLTKFLTGPVYVFTGSTGLKTSAIFTFDFSACAKELYIYRSSN